mgnify:FL=1
MSFDTTQDAYRALRDIATERTRNLIAWVGSGLSVAAGLPSWAGFKDHLLRTLRNKAQTFPEEEARKLEGAEKAATSEPNYWTAFQILRQHLGAATYRDSVRDVLKGAATVPVPIAYRYLWQMGIQGVLNLNLDRLATRGFFDQFPQSTPAEFSGKEVGRLSHLLNTPRRFVANLHGIAEDSDSWVLTRPELRELLDDDAYRTIIRTCLTSSTIVFVGITAEDVAVGGHLEALQRIGIEPPTHFWITHRKDLDTDRWAERNGIRVIRYTAKGDNHSELSDLFQDLLAFVPKEPDVPAQPVSLQEAPAGDEPLPFPEIVETWKADEIRRALNRQAVHLLEAGTEESYRLYEEFCRKYDIAIYRAWHTSAVAGRNQLLDYTLEKHIAQGAFGQVFRARDASGQLVAVKVLREEIRANPALLMSFRRGVRSMKILDKRQVDGMVAYTDHSEIPAFVAMDWIDGPNLTEAKKAGRIDEWSVLLQIAAQLAEIVRSAHSVPERVLHRDIRPQNVMLNGFYSNPDAWKVAVLDFDLSWHLGALEQSVLHTTTHGYLAPEQIQTIPGASTRNAAVDSFGLGMTLYYLCSGRDPLQAQHKHQNWELDVRQAISQLRAPSWRSLPERFARLIIYATRDRQNERWDFAEICGELKRLLRAAKEPSLITSAELLAEEIAATAKSMEGYQWNVDRALAEIAPPTGLRVSLAGEEAKQCLRMRVDWQSTGMQDWRRVGKNLKDIERTVVERLRAGGWSITTHGVATRSMHVEATLGVEYARKNLADTATALDHILERVRFS